MKVKSVGALWARKSRGGVTYYTGEITQEIDAGQQIVVFTNKYRGNPKSPDLIILPQIKRPGEGDDE